MTKSLIILESPNKIKAYESFLSKDFKVIASSGHIKDLPSKKLGIDIANGFEPQYETIPKKTKEIAEIRKCASEVDTVYLATDPDREGEAIAWHIAEVIKGIKNGPQILRILPQEISKKAILNEIAHPTQIDKDKYDSQQARRVLDRLVGYQISPILWDKVRRGLSAGRVQSVAVRLIVDRENAIRNYKQIEYWKIAARLETPDKKPVVASLVRDKKQTIYSDPSSVEKYHPKGVISNEAQAQDYVNRSLGAPFIVASVEKERRESRTNPPFSTADLLRCASSQLGFSSKTTSSIAQKLFESIDIADGPVGLITYIRTDSVRVSDEAIAACRKFIDGHYGKDYLPKSPIHHESAGSSKKQAVKIQDAHEAIRPTDVNRTPESLKPYLTRDQYKLYDLIWRRFVASQMAPAVSDVTTVVIENGDLTYRVSGSVPKFAGFKRALLKSAEADENETAELQLPELVQGQQLNCKSVDKSQQFTQPPKRYTEASFIKELKDKGIGRPSTITTTVVNIQTKGYVEKDDKDKTFHPTELGELVTGLLIESFPDILEVEYTKEMEDKLEVIAAGEQSWKQTLADFYGPFSQALEHANESMRNVKRESEKTDLKCDKCGADLVIKFGKNGHFLACSNYPKCKNTMEFTRNPDGTIVPQEKVIEYAGECPDCHRPMVIRSGKFGKFLACSGYPECKHTEAIAMDVTCPKPGCKGKIVQKRSKRGKVFYGCSCYPACDFVSWNEPTNETCPNCGEARLEVIRRSKSARLLCPKCAFSRAMEGEES